MLEHIRTDYKIFFLNSNVGEMQGASKLAVVWEYVCTHVNSTYAFVVVRHYV